VQKTVFPHPSQPLWQDVLQDSPEESIRRFRQGLPTLGLAVPVAEGHLFAIVGHDIRLPQHPAIEVTGQISQRVISAPDLLTLGDPVLGNGVRQGKALLAHSVEELGAEHPGQSPAIEQVLSGPALPARSGQPAAGDHDVDMGVEGQAPGVGVQHPHQPELVAQALIVAGKLVQGLPGNLEQGVTGPPKMMPGKAPQLDWQGEGHQEIVHRQQFLSLPLQPLAVGAVLTGRATAMAAGRIGLLSLLTGRALIANLAAVRRMTGKNGSDGGVMLRSHPPAITELQAGLMIAQDLRQRDHSFTQSTCRRSTRALIIRALFCWASWVIRV